MRAVAPVEDGTVAKIIKYIPAEIIALEQLLIGGAALLQADTASQTVIGWLSLGLLAFTPFWFAASTKEAGLPIAWSQVVLSTIAFAIWLFAVESPAIDVLRGFGFPETGLDKGLGSLLFAFFVAFTPMLERVGVLFRSS
jgi:hypothetical protein